jgi:hypothetical protein
MASSAAFVRPGGSEFWRLYCNLDCIHKRSIRPGLYTCDDTGLRCQACNSLILKKQTQNESGYPFASSELNEASARLRDHSVQCVSVRHFLSPDRSGVPYGEA